VQELASRDRGEIEFSDEAGTHFRVKKSPAGDFSDFIFQNITDAVRLRDYVHRYVNAELTTLSEEDLATFRFPERRFMTVSFTDMRGFTKLSETLPPEEVRATINAYLEEAITAIDEHGATVGLIVGDEVMALYGAPRPFPDHAWRAINTAASQQQKIAALQLEFLRCGKVMPDCGVGINSGDMVLGNIGSATRQCYTVIGLAVNLASRVCSAARAKEIILTEATLFTALNSLPTGWEMAEEVDPDAPLTLDQLGGKVEAVSELPANLRGRIIRVGPEVKHDPAKTVFLFRYLYAVKVKGVAEPLPILAAERVSEEAMPALETISEGDSTSQKAERILGRYRLGTMLGRGGMSEVWQARDQFGNALAVKILRAGQSASEQQLARFRREGQVMARLSHRHICRIFEIGEVEGITFIAMERIDGASLAEVLALAEGSGTNAGAGESTSDLSLLVREIRDQGPPIPAATERSSIRPDATPPLPIQQVLALMIKICDAVQFAHEHGILHRDLKPGNIMLRGDGEPVVTDFGLAKLVEGGSELSLSVTEQVVGTIEYMAPEQALSSKHVDERADVYSLGAMLYRLLTGARHFTPSDNLLSDAQRLQTWEAPRLRPLNPRLDTDLETITLKALRSDRAERYRSAAAFREDLERYQRSDAIIARPQTLGQVFWKTVRRHKAQSATIAAALLVLIGVMIAAFISIARERDKAVLARDDSDVHRRAAEAVNLAGSAPVQALQLALSAAEDARQRFGSPSARIQLSLTSVLEASREKGFRDPALSVIEAVAVSGRGSEMIVAGAGRAVFMDLQGHRRTVIEAHAKAEIAAVAINHDGSILVTSGKEGVVKVWKNDSSLVSEPVKLERGWSTSVAISPDGTVLATAEPDRKIHLQDLAGREIVPPLGPHANPISTVVFDRSGGRLASGDLGIFGTALRVWRLDGTLAHEHPSPHAGGVKAIAFSPAGDHLLSGGADKQAIAWKVELDGKLTPAVTLGEHANELRGVEFSPDGQAAISLTEDGELTFWEPPLFRHSAVTWVNAREVVAASFGSDRYTLITTGRDRVSRIWDLRGFEVRPALHTGTPSRL
jgi:serine/threonine protein kinase/class 3 adenylate cyclase